jgi:TetR/AcrR family transcriptional repressor of uid operon
MGGAPGNPGFTESGKQSLPIGHDRAEPSAASPDPKTRIRNSRSRQRADTKERIFETALREFRKVGFAAAQIDRIAKGAGIARGTFYFHFPTKDDVMLELARRINRRGARRLTLIAEGEPRLDEFLHGMVDILIDEFGLVSDAGLNAELLSLYIRRPSDLAVPSNDSPEVPAINDELVGYLRRAAERDGMQSPMAPEQLSLLIMSSLFGILARVPRGSGVRDSCHALVDLLVRGLQPAD